MTTTIPLWIACLGLAALPAGIAAPRDPLVVLRSGSSFGHCVGYCEEELELLGTRGRYERRAWRTPNGTTLAPKIQLTSLPPQTWRTLVRLADSLQLTKPQVVIGCPDCDDGGSEWIELVRQSGAKRRIVFQYHRYPAQAEALGPQLAALRESLAKASAQADR
ncbi:hypothetical protein [Cyanobium sp. ATX 6F1]|uniref:hypothetical protein n=1 Tax=unclassified Cyanobium TaxID=2627006 RepID=UPI0020CBC89E|nr:hypothetical protein [Cyanobium sp. ATX 6F1]MCP9916307.1 hypothetical protein [Cyanobium sp. ATX 6F1]